MGATSWHDSILHALLIGLVVQIVAYVLCVFWAFLWAFLWASWKERMARPATGESVAECDVEMGTVNVGEGATILDNPRMVWLRTPALGMMASLRTLPTRGPALQKFLQSTEHLPKTQCKNVTEDVKRRATEPVVVDVSYPQQVEVLAG